MREERPPGAIGVLGGLLNEIVISYYGILRLFDPFDP